MAAPDLMDLFPISEGEKPKVGWPPNMAHVRRSIKRV